MADIAGFTYIDIYRPSTDTTEHIPQDWTYVSDYGPWIKPNVPWPSADAPVKTTYPTTAIVPTSWVDYYGDLLPGKTIPKNMAAGDPKPAELAPPEPEPEPEPAPTFGVRVAKFLGRGDDTRLVALADEHAPVIEQFVNAYVRGNGVTIDPETLALSFTADLQSVILTATARLVVNPAQLERETYDGYSATGSFRGFTLPELAVLNRYRRRSA